MRKLLVLVICCAACWTAGSALADENKAAATTDANAAALEVRAEQYLNSSEWAQALPLYKKLAEMARNDPKKLGPIEENIRVCEKNIARLAKLTPSAPPSSSPTAAPVSVPITPLSNEQRKVHPAPKDGQVLDMTIKELGNFDFDQEKGGNIPADVKRLSGHPIRLKGFMIPMDQADNITKFALVPDLFSCCFGQPPQIQHMVVANCPQGKAVGYSPDEIMVEGKLNVEEKKDDGYIISIFEVSVSSVKAAPK